MNKFITKTYKNKKVLITGNTGFKGSWLSIILLEMGAEVFGYALPPKHERDNFTRSKLMSKHRQLNADIRDKNTLIKYINEVRPDFVFHLAAQAIVLDSYRNPSETFETNLMGTVNFFEAVRQCDSVKVAINVTSDKCYDNKEWIWGYRENDPMGGKDPYSASKGCAEIITSAYLNSFFKDNSCHIAS
ncbi:MAG: GDP-mannose 4,6-dehydratase, partial [Bacteroidia bacterium]